MASIIEGSLRTYLALKVIHVRSEKARIQDIIENYQTKQTKYGEGFFKLDSLSDYKKQIEKLNLISNRFDATTQIENINGKEWSNLLNIFKTIHKYDLETTLDKIDPELYYHIGYIFHFRNFLVHSNFIQLEIQANTGTVTPKYRVDFMKKSKMLSKYLKANNLENPNKKGDDLFFIEELLPDKLIFHFKDKLLDFLKMPEFLELSSMANQVNLIYRE